MATDPDRDAEDWFEALAGRRGGEAGARAMREALQAQARTLREAESARAEDLDVPERARMDALKARLQAAGAFRPAPAAPPAPGWGERLRALLLGDSWQRPLAIAAGLVLASVLALRLALPGGADDDPSRTLRGAPGSTLVAPDPAARSAALEARLREAGAEVVRVQVNAGEWSLLVSVPDAARLPPVRQRLREAGFQADGNPPFELSVRTPR